MYAYSCTGPKSLSEIDIDSEIVESEKDIIKKQLKDPVNQITFLRK